jgi:hypothetical protein
MTKDEALEKKAENARELGLDYEPAQEYERGFIDGMQKQMQSSVDKAVNAMTQPTYYIPNKDERTWVGLTDKEMLSIEETTTCTKDESWLRNVTRAIEDKLKEKNI